MEAEWREIAEEEAGARATAAAAADRKRDLQQRDKDSYFTAEMHHVLEDPEGQRNKKNRAGTEQAGGQVVASLREASQELAKHAVDVKVPAGSSPPESTPGSASGEQAQG